MSANVAELVEAEFGIVVAVSLERFKSNGWFAVGLTEAECPRCRSRMQGYRMPYTTKAGLDLSLLGTGMSRMQTSV